MLNPSFPQCEVASQEKFDKSKYLRKNTPWLLLKANENAVLKMASSLYWNSNLNQFQVKGLVNVLKFLYLVVSKALTVPSRLDDFVRDHYNSL